MSMREYVHYSRNVMFLYIFSHWDLCESKLYTYISICVYFLLQVGDGSELGGAKDFHRVYERVAN